MKKINKNVALFELGGSHTECMHTQIKALKNNGNDIYLICNDSLVNEFPDTTVFTEIQTHNINKSLKSQITAIKKIRKFLKNNDINTIIINTLEISIVRNLLAFLPLPKVKNYVGLLHNGKKINGKRRREFKWSRRRVNKIFVLSQNTLQHLNTNNLPFTINYFYPIYFPNYSDINISKPENEFWITVLGHMSRHDVGYIFQSMEKEKLDKSVRIILLGTLLEEEFPLYKQVIAESENLVKFNSRVPNNVVDAYLKYSDIVMPLFDHETMGPLRISGAYNSAYGYNIPLYIDNRFKNHIDFKEVALFFDRSENIVNQINQLINNKDEINKCKDALINHPIYSIEKQCEHFINIIFNE